jgi:hypothetical protein
LQNLLVQFLLPGTRTAPTQNVSKIEEKGLREKHMVAASSKRHLQYRDIDPMLLMGRATHALDDRPSLTTEDIRIHAWLLQRLALLQREQNCLWAKVRRFLFGTVHSTRD